MEMFFRILKKDLKRKKTINIILLLFVILATMFLASSVNNLTAVSGAVDHFIEIAKVPDYFTLSVVSGDKDEIDDYLKENEYVSEYEMIESFNLVNEHITIVECEKEPEKGSYERSNTLTIQAIPRNYMKVFDEENREVELKDNEIGFSKIEAEKNGLQTGDKVRIKVGEIEQEFVIKVIIKDAVFGSQMMGFKRLIITQDAFDRYKEQEALTYVKTYCIDYKDKESFESGWNKQKFNLMTNVDKDLVKMTYVMDMLVAAILIIVSICLILIAFLVLRFTIVFTLQEDYKEIGIMKAIGMRDMGIRSIYLVKYLAIAVIGAGIGLVVSFPFGNMLLEQVIVNIIVDEANVNFVLPVLCAVLIVMIVLGFCYFSTGRMKKYSAMDAIRNGSNGERYKVKNHLKLWKRKRMSPCFYMALNDILSSFKRFGILAVTFCIGTMMILLPLSAANTLKDDDIVKLFSMSPSDVYVDTGKMELYLAEKSIDKLVEDLQEIEKELEENGIEAYAGTELGYIVPCHAGNEDEIVSYFTLQATGSWEREYTLLEGREPKEANEIIITDITAEEMGVGIGDTLYFKQKDGTKEYVITGTFQSMMNMGKGFRVGRTAEIEYEFMAGIFCIQIDVPGMESEEACEKIKEIFPDYKVQEGIEFINTMIGGIMDQIETTMVFIVGIVLIINSLITVLIMKSIMAKERGDIALLKSMGFRNSAVKSWQIQRIIIVLVVAIGMGAVLSNLLAPYIIGPIFAMMGANKVELVMNPLEAYVFYPMILLVVTGVSAAVCAGSVRKVDLREVNSIE